MAEKVKKLMKCPMYTWDGETMNDDKYLGFGLVDKTGNALAVGDSVIFLGERYPLRLKSWYDPIWGMVKRVEISGGGYWLTPYSAGMCEKICRAETRQRNEH